MEDTIAAISTPMGTGGIAVIRISGDDAVKIADKVFFGSKKLSDVPTHTVHYGFIKDKNGNKIDEVLTSVMLAPKTFTREDTVEISVHGGITVSREALSAIVSAGARPAEPGEFTKRAFLNGRIDLSQAEAVIDIINAKTALAKDNALSQLEGSLSAEIKAMRYELVHLASQMQVIIDYPDEDLEDVSREDIENVCRGCISKAQSLLKTADGGKILRDGIRTAIAGKPNVGKSSLLNALSRSDRAIVTDIAGTTRDVIEEFVNLDGVPLLLADTAGIHDTEDVVEKIGVEKSRNAIEEAELVIAVLDGSAEIDGEDMKILEETNGKRRIVLINKSDISDADTERICGMANGSPVISVSAKTSDGIDKLSECIKSMYSIGSLSSSNGAVITNIRHKKALEDAADALKRAVLALSGGMPTDIASIDINAAIDSLGEITGETVSESIVNDIFHSFCVGK